MVRMEGEEGMGRGREAGEGENGTSAGERCTFNGERKKSHGRSPGGLPSRATHTKNNTKNSTPRMVYPAMNKKLLR
jgi:hypothetical protein